MAATVDLEQYKLNNGDDVLTKLNGLVTALQTHANELAQLTTDTQNWTSSQVLSAAASASLAQSEQQIVADAKAAVLQALADAVAVVSGGTASQVPEAAKMPIAGAEPYIDDGWLRYVIPQLKRVFRYLDVVAVDFGWECLDDSWRYRCLHYPYAKESRPTGIDRGEFANLAAAIAGGALIGDMYFNTISKKWFEVLTIGPDTEQEVYRFGSDEPPAYPIIIAEADRVVVFDTKAAKLTMWMVFAGSWSYASGNMLLLANGSNGSVTSLKARNGKIFVGVDPSVSSGGLHVFDLAKNSGYVHDDNGIRAYLGDIKERNANKGSAAAAGNGLVSEHVLDVAVAVLDDAPVDPATALKIPTVYVGTDAGASIIRHDEKVERGGELNSGWNVGSLIVDRHRQVWGSIKNDPDYGGLQLLSELPYETVDVIGVENGASNKGYPKTTNLSDSHGVNTSWPMTLGRINYASDAGDKLAVAGDMGLSLIHDNALDRTKSMIAHITDKYNTGWMVGDCQLAIACDTDLGSLIGIEYSINGGFDTDTIWTKGDGWSIAGGVATCDGTQAGNSSLQENATLVNGNDYLLTFEVTAVNAGAINYVDVGGVVFNDDISTTGVKSFSFTATEASTTIAIVADSNFDGSIDNVSLRSVTKNRAANGGNIGIHGTVGKVSVGGSEIAFVKDFGVAGNDLEWGDSVSMFPHNSDWSFCFWTDASQDFVMGQRGADAQWNTTDRAGFQIHIAGPGGSKTVNIRRYESTAGDLGGRTLSTPWQEDNTLKLVTIVKEGSSCKLYINGDLKTNDTTDWDTDGGAAYSNFYIAHATGNEAFALMRYSKTTLSADQIKKMYRDELCMIQGRAVLQGSDPDIKAIAVDESRGLIYPVSAGVVNAFQELELVESSLDGIAEKIPNYHFTETDVSAWVGGITTHDTTVYADGALKVAAADQWGSSRFDLGVVGVASDDMLLIRYKFKTDNGNFKVGLHDQVSTWQGSITGSGEKEGVFVTKAGATPHLRIENTYAGANNAWVDYISVKVISKAAPFQSVSALNGALLLGGANGFDVDIPAVNIRERLNKAVNDRCDEYLDVWQQSYTENGNFAAGDVAWSKGAGWSIANGKASCDGTQTAVSNLKNDDAPDVEANEQYVVTWTVSSHSAGTTKPNLGAWGTTETGNGTFSQTITASDAGDRVIIQASADFVGDIDDVSVYPAEGCRLPHGYKPERVEIDRKTARASKGNNIYDYAVKFDGFDFIVDPVAIYDELYVRAKRVA